MFQVFHKCHTYTHIHIRVLRLDGVKLLLLSLQIVYVNMKIITKDNGCNVLQRGNQISTQNRHCRRIVMSGRRRSLVRQMIQWVIERQDERWSRRNIRRWPETWDQISNGSTCSEQMSTCHTIRVCCLVLHTFRPHTEWHDRTRPKKKERGDDRRRPRRRRSVLYD